MLITINLNENEFPIIAQLKDSELHNTIIQLLKTAYNIHFPNNNTIKEKTEYIEIIQKIDIIKNEIKNEIANMNTFDKITSLENSLNKLIGISSNSYKKGNLAECILEDIISKRYGDIIYEKKKSYTSFRRLLDSSTR